MYLQGWGVLQIQEEVGKGKKDRNALHLILIYIANPYKFCATQRENTVENHTPDFF